MVKYANNALKTDKSISMMAVWDEITYSFPNFNGEPAEVWNW